MSIDRLIFRKPTVSYNEKTIEEQENGTGYIQWIPHSSNTTGSSSSSIQKPNSACKIPVLVMNYIDNQGQSSDSYLLYFHGNAEDLGMTRTFLRGLRSSLCVNIIAIEYPGYGIYSGKKMCARQIKEDALCAYDYLVKVQDIPEEKIIVFGRSIGSGPACEVASKRKPGKIILLSAFTSIKKLSSEIAFSLVSYFVKERFNNISNVGQFSSPCILIHGSNDKLIIPEHARQLHGRMSQNGCLSKLEIRQNMTHNTFHLLNDIAFPIQRFLRETNHQPQKISSHLLPEIFLGKEQRRPRALTNYSESSVAQELSSSQSVTSQKDKEQNTSQVGQFHKQKQNKKSRHGEIPQFSPKQIEKLLSSRYSDSTNASSGDNNSEQNQDSQIAQLSL